MNSEILITLLSEHMDKLLLQCRFTLIAVRALLHQLIGGDNGILACFSDDMKLAGQSNSHPRDKYRLILAFV